MVVAKPAACESRSQTIERTGAAIVAQRRPIGRRGLLGDDADDHVRHLFDRSEALQQ
jgi:hypothetical protein